MRRRNVVVALLVVVLAGLIVLPYATGDYYVHLIALVFINVMLAASLRPSLTCGQLNVGHSAFMLVGAGRAWGLDGALRPWLRHVPVVRWLAGIDHPEAPAEVVPPGQLRPVALTRSQVTAPTERRAA